MPETKATSTINQSNISSVTQFSTPSFSTTETELHRLETLIANIEKDMKKPSDEKFEVTVNTIETLDLKNILSMIVKNKNLPTITYIFENELWSPSSNCDDAISIVLETAIIENNSDILKWVFSCLEKWSEMSHEAAESTYDGQICLDSIDQYGKFPTELAVLHDRVSLLPMIMETYLRWHGVEKDDGNGWAQRGLYLAVSLDNIQLVRYFLKSDYASPTIKNPLTQKTPLEVAKERKNNLIIIVLSWYSTAPRYVVNCAAYVSSEDETDASDDEAYDQSFSFEENDFLNPPFSIDPKKRGILEEISFGILGKTQEQKSQVRQPILNKLSTESFEGAEEKDRFLSVSFGLNRPKSLSSGKNKLLYRETKASVNSPTKSLNHSFFWNYHWQGPGSQATRASTALVPVSYNRVHSFYKQLKRDYPEKARSFRKQNENQPRNSMVPYREIRETIKNDPNTKYLVQQARQDSSSAHVYLSFIDADTKRFGQREGLYTTYNRLAAERNTPDVMSTGYEYFDEKSHPLIQFASLLDRQVRAATAKHVPMGVYYPEPNVCVKVPLGQSTVPESFHELTSTGMIRKAEYDSPQESIKLLSKVRNRPGFSAVFASDNPLLTATTKRATIKKGGTSFNFGTVKLYNGRFYDWSWQNLIDISHNISQSHLHPMEWAHNILNAFEKASKVSFLFNSIPTIITNGSVIREIAVGLLTRLFSSYDPISIAKSPEILALKMNDEERFKHVLINYPQLIKNPKLPTKKRKEKKKLPLETKSRGRSVAEKSAKALADSLDTREAIKIALKLILIDCDPNLIEMAAKDSGMIIARTFTECFDCRPCLSPFQLRR